MRFIIMHRTNAHWESGAKPGPGLIARVGALLGEMGQAGVLCAAEGLRPSSEGVRVIVSDGTAAVANGPFSGDREPDAFGIIRAGSLEEAIDRARRAAPDDRDVEIDIRPVTEPWDIGMAPPVVAEDRRYMMVLKTTTSTDGVRSVRSTPSGFARRVQEMPIEPPMTERMRPKGRGRRYSNSVDGISVYDGPFAETTEVIGGYVIVDTVSFDDADRWARRYLQVVAAEQVDVRELL